jgi:hypothetical protein
MPTPRMTEEQCRETLALLAKHNGNQSEAARALGIPRPTFQARVNTARSWVAAGGEEEKPDIGLPVFPDDDLPVEDLIAHQSRRFERRLANKHAKKWYPISLKTNEPIGITFFGDPHVDDNGCNWPLLQRHCEIHRKTPGLYGVNVGDTTNNWVGRLARLFGNQDTSQSTARKFAKWLLADSGVTWLTWIMGNHDMWNDGDAILRAMGGHMVPMEDWQAQFKLVFPNKRECRAWTAHNFPGHSMWNTLHGPQKAAHTKDWAHIYACGHTHNWAMHQEESASKDFIYWLIRSRGYKFIDDHAEQLGHASQQEGASICAVINPTPKSQASFVQCYADVEEAADFLKHLRRRK